MISPERGWDDVEAEEEGGPSMKCGRHRSVSTAGDKTYARSVVSEHSSRRIGEDSDASLEGVSGTIESRGRKATKTIQGAQIKMNV